MLIYYDHTVHMSHWEGFGTLLMATDTSNALLDPVLYGAYTVCSAILLLHRKMEHDGNADPHDSRRFCKKVSESAACLRSRLAWALGLARRTREDELMRRS